MASTDKELMNQTTITSMLRDGSDSARSILSDALSACVILLKVRKAVKKHRNSGFIPTLVL